MLGKASGPKTFAVIDVSRAMGQHDIGPLVSIHTGQKASAQANKAAKKIQHARVLELKPHRDWQVGDHINGRIDVVHQRNARWL
jgi:hypothetical protein